MKTNHAADGLDFSDSLSGDSQKVVINQRLYFEDRDGYRVVFCRHEPLYRFAVSDKQHRKLVAVSLRLSELATQAELAQAFGHSVAAQRRWEESFKASGLAGLGDRPKPGRPATVAPSQHAFLIRWFHAGVSLVEMARRLGVSKDSVQRTLKRLGLQRRPAAPPSLPFAEAQADSAASQPTTVAALPVPEEPPRETLTTTATNVPPSREGQEPAGDSPSEPSPSAAAVAGLSIDRDPTDRAGDRLLARQGLLHDTLPLFADAEALPRAGVLLAISRYWCRPGCWKSLRRSINPWDRHSMVYGLRW